MNENTSRNKVLRFSTPTIVTRHSCFFQTLPKIAAEIAAPLSSTKKITMVSDGSGEVGASRLTNEVMDIVERIPKLVEDLTGVNISKNSLS